MVVKSLEVGPLGVNCYVIADEETGKVMVVDPGDEPDMIMEIVEEVGAEVGLIVLTHAHFDHVGAVSDLKEITDAPIVVHKDEMSVYDKVKDQASFWGYLLEPLPKPDELVQEGDEINIGSTGFTVIHTPGHTPGGMCLYGGGFVITGDTLFRGSVGRTDFPGGDIMKLKTSFKRLMGLPDATVVLSGHGPASTIREEKAGNFFASEVGL